MWAASSALRLLHPLAGPTISAGATLRVCPSGPGRRLLASAGPGAAPASLHRRDSPAPTQGPAPTAKISVAGQGELARDFIDTSLYHEEVGYFNRSRVIASVPQPVNWRGLRSRREYEDLVQAMYLQHEQSWMTPVEIFTPVYGQLLLDWILSSHDPREPLRIYEVGGGTGRCAKDILDELRRSHPEIYARTHYTIIDRSDRLAHMQSATLKEHGAREALSLGEAVQQQKTQTQTQSSPQGPGPKIRLVRSTITEWKGFEPHPCYIIGLEVLDNMPHDKVVRHRYGGPLLQTHLFARDRERIADISFGTRKAQAYPFVERFKTLSDPTILRYLRLVADYVHTKRQEALQEGRPLPARGSRRGFLSRLGDAIVNKILKDPGERLPPDLAELGWHGGAAFVPTVQLQFLEVLQRSFPQHQLLLADFDYLPDGLPGYCGPMVHARNPRTKRFDRMKSYTVPIGTCDIFFPTDFGMLQHAYQTVCGKPAEVLKHEDWVRRYPRHAECQIGNGYNPLASEYGNFRLLVTRPPPPSPQGTTAAEEPVAGVAADGSASSKQ